MALVLGELSVILSANPTRFASAMARAEKSLERLVIKLHWLKAAARNLDTASAKMTGLASASKGIGIAAKRMRELEGASRGLKSVASRAAGLERMGGTLRKVAAGMREVDKSSKGMERAAQRTDRLGTAMRGLDGAGARMRGVGVASLAMGVGIASVGIGLLRAASSADETASFMRVAFGSSAGAVEEWAARTGGAMNRSQYQMREFATTLQAMLSGMVGSEQAAAEMSMRMAELAVDIGSARNIADSLALEKLRAGLAGEMEPLRQLGIVMSVAELSAFALASGIKASYRSMTEAEKVALRYRFILAKTSLDQGDAVRTAGSLTNRMKGMTGQVRDLAVELGQRLVPVAQDLVSKLQGILRWFDKLDSGTKNLLLKVGIIAGGLTILGAALIPLGAVVSALATIGGILASVVSPALLLAVVAVAAVVAGFGALKMAWEEFETPIKGGLDWIVERLDDFLDRIDSTIERLATLGMAVKEAFDNKDPIAFGKALARLALAIPKAIGNPLQIGTPQDQIPEGASNEDRVAIVGAVASDALAVVTAGVKDFVLAPLKEAFLNGLSGLADLVPPELKEKLAEWQAKLKLLIDEVTKVTDMVGAGDGGPGDAPAAMEVVAKAAKTLGERLIDAKNALLKWFNGLPGAAGGAASVFGKAVISGSPQIGAMVEGGEMGSKAGPWGAVAGAVMGLLTTSEQFKELLEVVNRSLGFFADKLGTILEPWTEIVEGLFAAVRPLVALIAPLLRLNPAIFVLTQVVTALTVVTKWLFEAFRIVAVGFLKAVRFVLKTLGRSTKKVDRALDDLKEMSYDSAGAIEDLGDAAGAAAEALINVPEGFKIAQYRWESMLADYAAGGPGGSGGPGGNLAEPGGVNLGEQGGSGDPNGPPAGGWAPPGWRWVFADGKWVLWPSDSPHPSEMEGGSSGNGATSGSSGNGASSASSGVAPNRDGGGNTLYVENLYATDPDEALDAIERAARRRNYIRRGNPNPTPPGIFGRKQ